MTNVTNGKAPFRYIWSNSDTTKTIKNLSAGKYSVTISDANGCVYSTILTVSAPSSSSDAWVENILLYPNPTSDKLYITNITEPLRFSLYDMSGKLMFSKFINYQIEIDLSHLPKGVYLSQLEDEKGSVKKGKLVVQ